jgi:integrase
MKSLSKEQIRAMLTVAKAESERDFQMIQSAYLHGLRATEVVKLKAGSIRDGYLTVQRGKGSKKTTQPLIKSDDPLFDEATTLLNFIAGMPPEQMIFSVSRLTLWRAFQKHGRTAGVPAHLCHPHAAKHGCGKSLSKKLHLAEVQKWMGHVSGASTMIYMEPDDAEVEQHVIETGALV